MYNDSIIYIYRMETPIKEEISHRRESLPYRRESPPYRREFPCFISFDIVT